jgi:hypothetical protein
MSRIRFATVTVLASRERDREADVGLGVAQAEAGKLGEAVGDGRDLPEAHDLAAAALEDQVLELLRRLDAADEADALLLERALDAAHRRCGVLQAQRVHHVRHRDVVFAQLLRAQQHRELAAQRAVHVDDGHAVDRTEPVRDDVLGEARDLRVALVIRRERQLHDRRRGRIDAPQDRLAHLHRQLVAHRGDRVADLVGGLHHVLLEVEDDDDLRAALGSGRADLVDLRDALQRLLDAVDDLALDRLG